MVARFTITPSAAPRPAVRATRPVSMPQRRGAGGKRPARRVGVSERVGRVIDRVVGVFSPEAAARRMLSRATLNQIEIFANGQGGYDAGKVNTQTKGKLSSRINENAIPLTQIQRLRWQANDLFRNNPHGRKVVRSLEAKVIGRGLRPQSHALLPDGTPDFKFRRRAQELWKAIQGQIDYRGRPGRGGFSFVELQKQALRSAILSGDLLWHLRPLDSKTQKAQNLHIPLQLQLIHTERLAEYLTLASEESNPENRIFRGIEMTPDGIPVAYWILRHHPSDPLLFSSTQQADRYEAKEIGHLYVADDVDQFRGVTWFATVLLQMRDTADYQYNELKASALAACVAMWYKRPGGMGTYPGIGTQVPAQWDLTDGDGNPVTAMQPGMMVDLGPDGEMGGFNPARPSTNVEAFSQHMTRTTSRGIPGVKSSTLTGDYRRSSFSSEKSEDNDIWPELEGLQDWFASGFCQPIYEEVVAAGVLAGYFSGIVTPGQFNARRNQLLQCAWQGPVARSINPKDDSDAAYGRVKGFQSTPQLEMARVGLDWHDGLQQFSEFIAAAEAEGIAPDLVQQWLGIPTVDRIQGDPQSAGIDDDPTPAQTGAASGESDDSSDTEEDLEPQAQSAAA